MGRIAGASRREPGAYLSRLSQPTRPPRVRIRMSSGPLGWSLTPPGRASRSGGAALPALAGAGALAAAAPWRGRFLRRRGRFGRGRLPGGRGFSPGRLRPVSSGPASSDWPGPACGAADAAFPATAAADLAGVRFGGRGNGWPGQAWPAAAPSAAGPAGRLWATGAGTLAARGSGLGRGGRFGGRGLWRARMGSWAGPPFRGRAICSAGFAAAAALDALRTGGAGAG